MRLLDKVTPEEIKTAAENGISRSVVWKRLSHGWDKVAAITRKPAPRNNGAKIKWETEEYAAYRGDDFLSVGTVHEIAEELGIEVRKIKYYTYASYKKRNKNGIMLELIEEDGGEE